MPRLRRNEWNFAANAARIITEILNTSEFNRSPLGHAEAELTELRGARRLDIVIFGRETSTEPLITGELKLPWDIDGRTPYNTKVVNDAHGKASRAGALYFITWNVRRIVIWKTDDPGVGLMDRVIDDRELVPETVQLLSASDLSTVQVQEAIQDGIYQVIRFLHTALTGPPAPSFLPLDRLFIARLESALDFPIQRTALEMRERMHSNAAFKRAAEKWMRDVQGWVVTDATESQNINHAARFSCYVLVNRLCFYDALRRKYREMPRLAIANSIRTADALKRKLNQYFEQAKRYTGNYDTVFDGDYGDNLPFLADEAVPEWRGLIRSLDHYDFANIGLDVIGAMYEQLIKPAERHRYGQHYTQPTVVDLINAFAVTDGGQQILDPGCGGGTFLVRAYARKVYLDETQDHSELLETLYGCDILNYACHLAIINLAIRDLIDDDNFPRIHLGDFLKYRAGELFSEQPVRIQAGGLVTEKREIRLAARSCDAIVGNPPYISAKEMRAADRQRYHENATRQWGQYPWRRASDIYVYFWLHAEHFLKTDGCLALLTQAGWLDVDYGIPLQQWMLDHFQIVAVLETEAEPWFTDARVATAVTILRREHNPERRLANRVKFIQFHSRLLKLAGNTASERDRHIQFETLRDRLLGAEQDTRTEDFRVRVITQAELASTGKDEDGNYIGSKWGRYLRSTDLLYSLQRTHPTRFVPLRALAEIRRGTTTNCDNFFIVTDISEKSLSEVPDARSFRARFRVERHRVTSREAMIVRRKDGVELALETEHLKPIIKTARDIRSFATVNIDTDFAVFIPEERTHLTRLAREYVEAGEREGWHQAPSFESIREAGGNWYSLREAEAAPILFVKTMQYSPLVLWNNADFLANQRLYTVRPLAGIDSRVLCAVLNSTLFACERYAAVKALGREAAIDVEVFSASAYRTPDIRQLEPAEIDKLQEAMDALATRTVGDMVEKRLLELDLSAARAYAANNPVQRGMWPNELFDPARVQIDGVVLRLVGVPSDEVAGARERLVNELVAHTRKLRLLELEAQINRQGVSGKIAPSAHHLADAIWAHFMRESRLEVRRIPDDFIAGGMETQTFELPVGRAQIEHPNLFDAQSRFFVYIGRTRLETASLQQAQYLSLLAEYGLSGNLQVPCSPQNCLQVMQAIREYREIFLGLFHEQAQQFTSDLDLQRRISREGWKRIVQRK